MVTSKERSLLRSLGNELEPIITVGKAGVNDNIVMQLGEALTARELVKGRVLPHTEHQVIPVAADLVARTNSEVILTIGRNFLIYRAPKEGIPSKLNWSRED